MRTVTEMIDPIKAKKWLDATHLENRPINRNHVHELAREMKMGRWVLTHQGLAIDTKGQCLDGQHRLWAIIECGMTIPMRVTYDVPLETWRAIDLTYKRSMEVITAIRGDYNKIYHLMAENAGISHPSPTDNTLLHDQYKETVDLLGTLVVPFYTSAPIKTAAVVRLASGENPQYVVDTFKNMLDTRNHYKLPQVANILINFYQRKLGGIGTPGGSRWRNKIFIMAMFVFEERNKDRQRISYQTEPGVTSKYELECRQVVKELVIPVVGGTDFTHIGGEGALLENGVGEAPVDLKAGAKVLATV